MIEVKGLRKSYRMPAGELEVLKGLDLFIPAGEMTAIVGASGVGKSTLLHILGTLDRPTEGSVLYDDMEVFSLQEARLTAFRNRTIGFVFQCHHLLPEFSALENVMMPALIHGGLTRREAAERAMSLLGELGLSHRHAHRPGELSGGEQQRTAVARALILHPRVVLADEPTGNLDTATGEELFGVLVELNRQKGITFVIVTHNEHIAARCQRVVTMVDGMVQSVKQAA
ncbi:MAG: ABC transporter ATP-binding protein [Nitrospirota bacterium]